MTEKIMEMKDSKQDNNSIFNKPVFLYENKDYKHD